MAESVSQLRQNEHPMVVLCAGFGMGAHAQQRYGHRPYHYHLFQVYRLTVEFGFPELVRGAAWLHDVLEDTAVTYDYLKRAIGSKSHADLVWAVTNDPDPELGYKERTYAKIKDRPWATQLKLCDRIANVEASLEFANTHMLEKYRKDHSVFVGFLWNKRDIELWDRLDAALGIDR